MHASLDYFRNIPDDDVVVNKYHLDVNQMLDRFKRGECPTLLGDMDQYRFLETSLIKLLKSERETSALSFRNTTPEKRKKKIIQLFVAAGISEDFYNEDGERFLDEVVNLKQDEFIRKVQEKRKEEEKKAEETNEE